MQKLQFQLLERHLSSLRHVELNTFVVPEQSAPDDQGFASFRTREEANINTGSVFPAPYTSVSEITPDKRETPHFEYFRITNAHDEAALGSLSKWLRAQSCRIDRLVVEASYRRGNGFTLSPLMHATTLELVTMRFPRLGFCQTIAAMSQLRELKLKECDIVLDEDADDYRKYRNGIRELHIGPKWLTETRVRNQMTIMPVFGELETLILGVHDRHIPMETVTSVMPRLHTLVLDIMEYENQKESLHAEIACASMLQLEEATGFFESSWEELNTPPQLSKVSIRELENPDANKQPPKPPQQANELSSRYHPLALELKIVLSAWGDPDKPVDVELWR